MKRAAVITAAVVLGGVFGAVWSRGATGQRSAADQRLVGVCHEIAAEPGSKALDMFARYCMPAR